MRLFIARYNTQHPKVSIHDENCPVSKNPRPGFTREIIKAESADEAVAWLERMESLTERGISVTICDCAK